MKKITKVSTGTNITAETKFVQYNSFADVMETTYIGNHFNKNIYMFVKLTFNSLDSTDIVQKGAMRFLCSNTLANTTFKLYRVGDLDFSNNEELMWSLFFIDEEKDVLSTSRVIDINSSRLTATHEIDISSAVKGITSRNNVAYFVLANDSEDTYATIYGPEVNECEVQSYVSTTEGINSYQNYSDYICSFTKGYIGTKSGRLVQSVNLYNGQTKKIPINLSLYFNEEKYSTASYIGNNYSDFNYIAHMYFYDDALFINDATGYEKEYKKLDTESSTFSYEDYNIKHYSTHTGFTNLYFCEHDASYCYLLGDYLYLYDKHDNYYKYKLGFSFWKLLEVKDNEGNTLTYAWDDTNNRVDYITSSDGDGLWFGYTNSKLTSISSLNYNQFISFEYDTNKIIITKSSYKDYDNLTDITENEKVELNFVSNKINSIKDIKTNDELIYTRDANNYISSVVYKNGTNYYLYDNFEYFNDHTKKINYKNEYICYYFDQFNRNTLIIDHNGNCTSMNYNIDNKNMDKANVVNNIRHSRNLLQNGEFESTDYWQISSITSEYVTCVEGGKNNKCLCVNKQTSNAPVISQTVSDLKPGKYYLSGYVKKPAVSGVVQVSVSGSYVINGVSTSFSKIYTDFNLVNQWDYFETNRFVIPETATGNVTVSVTFIANNGKYYIDSFKLSKVEHDKRNLVENGYFDTNILTFFTNWTSTNCSYTDIDISTDDHPSSLGEKVLWMYASQSTSIKRITNLISTSGNGNEKLEFSAFAKQEGICPSIFRGYVKVNYKNIDSKYYYFDFDKFLRHWQATSGTVLTEDSYSSIEIGAEYKGVNAVLFDCFQLYRGLDNCNYTYSNDGNLNEISTSNTSSQVIYNSNNQVIKIYETDGICTTYEYGKTSNSSDYNKIKTIKDSLGNVTSYTYDSNGYLKTIAKSNDSIQISETSTNDSKGNKTSIVSEGVTTTLSYDSLSRLIQQKLGTDAAYKYIYNADNTIKQVYTSPSTNVNSLIYDSWKNIKTLTNSNGNYLFNYDICGNVTSVVINNVTFVTYVYETLSLIINNTSCSFVTNKLLSATFNNGDTYEYVYDCDDKLIQINLNNQLLLKVTCNVYGNVVQSRKDNIVTKYIYNDNNQLVEIISKTDTINNIYVDNKLVKKNYEFNDSNRTIDYRYINDNLELNRDAFIGRLANRFGDEIIIGDWNLLSGVYGTKEGTEGFGRTVDQTLNLPYWIFSTYDETGTFNLDKFHCSSNSSKWQEDFKKNKTFLIFMKFSNDYDDGNIFRFYENEVLKFKLDFNSDAKIELTDGNGIVLGTSNQRFIPNDWNLLGIKFDNDAGTALLIVNSDITCISINSNTENIDKFLLSKTDIPSGSTLSSELLTPFNVYMLIVGAYDYTQNDLINIYKEGIDKYLLEEYTPTLKDETKYYSKNILDEYEIISLDNCLVGSKGTAPYEAVSFDGSYKTDKLRYLFEKDEQLVYGNFNLNYKSSLTPDGKSCLGYKFNDNGKGKVIIKFKLESSINNSVRTIVSFSNSTNSELMHVDARNNGYIDVVVNGSVVATFDTNFNDNNWHTLFIDYNDHYIITVIDSEREVVAENPGSFNDIITYIGCSKVRNTKLNGYIELVAHSNTSVETSSGAIDAAYDFDYYSVPVRIINEYDSFGRKTLKRIESGNYYSRDYINYKTNSYLPMYEEYNNGSIIIYSYDTSNRLTNYDNEIQNTSYTYDSLGRLTKEVDTEHGTIDYTYDINGNIVSKIKSGKYSLLFTYDETHKDRLKKVTDSVNNITTIFEYNGRLGYPTKIGNNTLTWEGKNLKTYGNNTYYYNADGLRYKKVTSQGTFNYTLDGDKIIRMNKDNSIIFDFTYDVNGLLVGLTYSNNEYFYMRDSFGNILGIIDKTGSTIVEYVYDAYGNTLREIVGSSTDSNASTIRTYNPFRYKGYYYDVETQLFYCNSRYYSPELCRWISPDSIEYLDPQSINGLNLYCYCMNNPIMYADPSGHFAITSFLIGLGISALIGAVAGGVSYAASELVSYAFTGEFSWSWASFTGSVLGGAIGGALAAIPGVNAMVVAGVSGFASTAIGMRLENAWEGKDYTFGQIMFVSTINGLISSAAGGLFEAIPIKGLTSGRGSYSAITKQITTKFFNGTIKRITYNTFSKNVNIQYVRRYDWCRSFRCDGCDRRE